MSKQEVMELFIRDRKTGGAGPSKPITIHSIENADKNPKAI